MSRCYRRIRGCHSYDEVFARLAFLPPFGLLSTVLLLSFPFRPSVLINVPACLPRDIIVNVRFSTAIDQRYHLSLSLSPSLSLDLIYIPSLVKTLVSRTFARRAMFPEKIHRRDVPYRKLPALMVVASSRFRSFRTLGEARF